VTANASIGAVGHANNMSKIRKLMIDNIYKYKYIYINMYINTYCRSIDVNLQLFGQCALNTARPIKLLAFTFCYEGDPFFVLRTIRCFAIFMT